MMHCAKIEVNGNTLEIVYGEDKKRPFYQSPLANDFNHFEINLFDMLCTDCLYVGQQELSTYINTHTEEAFDRAVMQTSSNSYLLDIRGGECIFGGARMSEDSPAGKFLIEHNMELFKPLITLFETGKVPNNERYINYLKNNIFKSTQV